MARKAWITRFLFTALLAGTLPGVPVRGQLTDITQTPNAANAGIHKSLAGQVGAGRGDAWTPDSSVYLVQRDPFRSIARGRQVFQRKFTLAQGLGPRTGDGVGDIAGTASIGAGLADSCGACHSRPFGSAGVGGNVFTRPDSRDTPHLFGLGLQEMLADEISAELRAVRDRAVGRAQALGRAVAVDLVSKGIGYGALVAIPDGTLDASAVEGVAPDLRVRPFFAEGTEFSIRGFVVGALDAEMGLEVADPDLLAAASGASVTTPAGMRLDGRLDALSPPPAAHALDDPDGDGVADEVPVALVDHLEFYLLNYFKPGLGEQDADTAAGFSLLRAMGCTGCHVPDLPLMRDRRVADVETVYEAVVSNGVFNSLYAVASLLAGTVDDGSGLPPLVVPAQQPFLVRNIFTDFKRHDLGPAFHERNFDGSVTTHFMTEPLWGVADTAPYGHDGRSATLRGVIARHGGEAASSRDAWLSLTPRQQQQVLAALGSLVLFAPPDTSSNLDPTDRGRPGFPFEGKGSIDLRVLFLDPTDEE